MNYVENAKIYSYGHSYTMDGNPYITPGGEYQKRLGKRLLSGPVHSRGRSGTWLPETFSMALSEQFGGSARTWSPGSKGIVLIQNYMNEVSNAQGCTNHAKAMWLQAARSLIALVSCAKIIPAEQATYSGNWSTYVNPAREMFHNSDVRFSSTAGATVSYEVEGDEAWIVSVASSPGYNVAPLSVQVNGVSAGSIATNGVRAPYNNTVNTAYSFITPMAYKVSGLNELAGTTGKKTLTIVAPGGLNAWVNCVMQPSPTPPAVFLAKESKRNPQATSGAELFEENDPSYRAMVDNLVAEFPNVHSVDLNVGWDNSTMVGSLDVIHNFHPNDLGMIHIADRFEQAITSTIVEPNPGVIQL